MAETKNSAMKFRGIIFDFNGVLWWDNHLQEQAWSQFAETILGGCLSAEAMVLQVHGRDNRHTLEYLIGSTLEVQRVEQLSEQKEKIYRELCLAQGDDFKLSPGAIDLLDNLAAHDIPRTIATASGRLNLDFFVEHLHLDQWFEIEKIVYDDGKRPGKPEPDIYLQAADLLGLIAGECVVVEDSLSGVQAAHAAGIGYIIAMRSSINYKGLDSVQGVNSVVDNLGQIPWEDLLDGSPNNLIIKEGYCG
jgi:beta-phosphoglucomutase